VLVAALLAVGPASAGEPAGLVLVASTDSARIFSGMDVPLHARLENRGPDTCWVGTRFPGEVSHLDANVTILDLRAATDGSFDARSLHNGPDDHLVVLGLRGPVALPPGGTFDLTPNFHRLLARPGVYRLRCDCEHIAVRKRATNGPDLVSLRSNAFTVRVDPITAEDMARLAAAPDSTVRARACFLVAGWGSSAAQRRFVDAVLADSAGLVRLSAVGSLSGYPYWRLDAADAAHVMARVGRLKEDTDPRVREAVRLPIQVTGLHVEPPRGARPDSLTTPPPRW
jgi:hypothetical protein